MKETRNEKWLRLSAIRLNRFKDTMLLIANLSESRYNYTKEEIEYYFSYLEENVEKLKKEFQTARSRKSELIINDIGPWHQEPYSDMNEKFHKLMLIRMNRIIYILRLLTNLTNRSHYEFYSYEVKQVFNYIDEIIQITKSYFIGLGEFSFIDYEKEQEYLRDKRNR